MAAKIYVGNLPPGIPEFEVEREFARSGEGGSGSSSNGCRSQTQLHSIQFLGNQPP